MRFLSMTYIRNDEFCRAVGLKIKKLRIDQELSQYKLANKAGIDRSQLIDVETAKINTTISTIYVIAKALEVEPYELLNVST